MNYFELFGLPTQFVLDSEQLSRTYRQLQKKFHPDNFATASERDKRMAVDQAATINDAYFVLRANLSRAIYLLELQGLDIKNEQKTMQDMAFLMTQMELRETLESIPQSADPMSELMALQQEVAQINHTLSDELRDTLANALWDEAADAVRKLQFIAKLEQQIEQQEDALF
ncbi:Co-chaperone protein HscB [Vibrio stylophorae]|uniref:Co-chaperone protein HscB homolog n=1 Tax=Vibrio stylophorae TaxID=659351 RepID=A0ABM8ZRC6_9VIBR|nr:co-chaperone HscB [Vibrio stylophorae]CAH0532856.1 Co-chaperone protein HscB [Vibrio stylophorae]